MTDFGGKEDMLAYPSERLPIAEGIAPTAERTVNPAGTPRRA
jgi:hypothetical protein